MTERQLRLWYREAIRREHLASTARIADVNVAQAGGEHASERVAALNRPPQ